MHEKQVKILELGARIQYFTINHLWHAGIYSTASTSTAKIHLRELKNNGYITASHHGIAQGLGRLHALYGLTPKAVKYLSNEENHSAEKIKVSKSNKNQEWERKAPADYFHRVGLLDSVLSCLLMLDQQGIHEEFLELYFRRFGMHQPRRTTIELPDGARLEPDAILSFQSNKKPRLYLIEFYEDSANNERIKRAVERHAIAITTGAPSIALGLSVGHRVLMVFRHDHTAKAILQHFKESPELQAVADRFLFKTHASIMSDAFDHWADYRGGKINIL